MVAGMTGSGKILWVQSMLQQVQTVNDQPPEIIICCQSQWQPAYTQLLMTILTIKFVKGILESPQNDPYLDVNLQVRGNRTELVKRGMRVRFPLAAYKCFFIRKGSVNSSL